MESNSAALQKLVEEKQLLDVEYETKRKDLASTFKRKVEVRVKMCTLIKDECDKLKAQEAVIECKMAERTRELIIEKEAIRSKILDLCEMEKNLL